MIHFLAMSVIQHRRFQSLLNSTQQNAGSKICHLERRNSTISRQTN